MLTVNACLGFREEYHTKKALDELSNQLESEVTIRREGETMVMPVQELVPRDFVLLVGSTVSRQTSNGSRETPCQLTLPL